MKKLACLTILSALAVSPNSHAYDTNTWVLGLGYNNIGQPEDTLGFRAEYRNRQFENVGFDGLSWMAGVDLDTEGAIYGYGGLVYDWQVAPRWHITPHVAMGLYDEGDSRDLGGTFEFREGIELYYKLNQDSRVGLGIVHLSNAGIYDHNPGAEHITLSYSRSLK